MLRIIQCSFKPYMEKEMPEKAKEHEIELLIHAG